MKKQKIGNALFGIGVVGLIIKFSSNWVQNQIIRANTPETLI